MKFFLPRQFIFFDLFGELSGCLKEMSQLFSEFVDNFNNFESYCQRAKEIEHRADAKTHEIIDLLNKSFITPFDREDLYQLAHEIDDIIDYVENVIHNIKLYQITEPRPAIFDFRRLILAATDELNYLLEQLRSQKSTPQLNGSVVKIHGLEDQGDLVFQNAMSQLFQQEQDPMIVIKWKDILANLEKVMDKFQSVSDTIEGVIVKFS